MNSDDVERNSKNADLDKVYQAQNNTNLLTSKTPENLVSIFF